MIQNDDQLREAAAEAGYLIQQMQNYLGRRVPPEDSLLRFPRGFLYTAAQARRRFQFLADSRLRANISYTLQLADVQHWILTRTDLGGLAWEMEIKLQLFLLGSIVESVTKSYLHGRCGQRYAGRTQYLVDNNLISPELKTELDWLWGIRNRMHLFQLDNIEWAAIDYNMDTLNRALVAFNELLDRLGEHPQAGA